MSIVPCSVHTKFTQRLSRRNRLAPQMRHFYENPVICVLFPSMCISQIKCAPSKVQPVASTPFLLFLLERLHPLLISLPQNPQRILLFDRRHFRPISYPGHGPVDVDDERTQAV